ncbi:MAG: flagellar biosynthetic protein FliQ [Deltaproteobacteria bacterium]|nr:flagellar biosynthetic protein FliQ [Deltaproteobacteria bacterium]
MNYELIAILFDGLVLVIVLSSLPLGTAFIVGVISSILQTATQIQEQTISLIAKWVAIVMVFLIFGAWMGEQLVDFFVLSFSSRDRSW